MNFWKRFSRGELRLTRIEAFRDGVSAVVVTLLVPELNVPSLRTHHILGLARHADYGMVFPTALMDEYPVAFNTLLFLVLHAYITRKLIKPELAGAQDPHILRKSLVGPLSYPAGVAAAWLNVHAAFCVYLLTPLFFIVPPQPKATAARR